MEVQLFSSCTPTDRLAHPLGCTNPCLETTALWDSQPYSLFSWAQFRDCQHLSGLHIDGRQSVPTCKKTYTSRHMPIKKTYA